jgi:hypothetical protein
MKKICFTVFMVLFCLQVVFSQKDKMRFDKYHSPEELNEMLKSIAKSYDNECNLYLLTKSAGGREIFILEIGSETKKEKKSVPAVFIAANMEGVIPLSSEAAIFSANKVLEQKELLKDKTFYILACGNPDALQRYFNKIKYKDARNDSKYNDDMDEQTDEDGYEDLDKNGFITEMRVKDPKGEWITSESDPRIMKKADWAKGEKGIYKLYSEGIDDDNDGKYNEDPPGGVNIGINFPQLFKFFNPSGGAWAGSEAESFSLIKFLNNHKEIGLVFVFGSSNYCLNPPKSIRKSDFDPLKIMIPPRFAQMLNVELGQIFNMQEVIELVKSAFPDMKDVNESMITNMMGAGVATNPNPEDLKFYTELSEKYKEFIKKNKVDEKRLEPENDKDGSLELWTYYNLGLATFAMDFWTLPEPKEEKKKDTALITPEKVEGMKDSDFILLGEEKITKFLKDNNAPDFIKADQIIKGIKSGNMNTKKLAEMLKKNIKPKTAEENEKKMKALLAFSDSYLNGKGFVEWKPYKHPALGDIDIGGVVPFADNTPPDSMIQKLLDGQVPWIFEIVKKMPEIKISKTEVKNIGDGLYEIKTYIENTGYLPYPTSMGVRTNRITPVVASLEGKDFKIIEGKKRSLIRKINGYSNEIVRWLILADRPMKIDLKVTSMFANGDNTQIQVGGGK